MILVLIQQFMTNSSRKESVMLILQNEQLFLLKQTIKEMLTMLNTYDISATAKFQPTLQMIFNNIEQCIKNDFDGINELSRYIFEDWRTVCVGKNGMENWYLNISDVILKGKLNKSFEEVALSVERILGTNFLVPRNWYSYNELIRLEQKYKEVEKDWSLVIEELTKVHKYYQSPMKQVPNDIWSFAKMLCLVETDDALKEWFTKDIPAFGYISPVQILQIENGDNILRILMYSIHFC